MLDFQSDSELKVFSSISVGVEVLHISTLYGMFHMTNYYFEGT